MSPEEVNGMFKNYKIPNNPLYKGAGKLTQEQWNAFAEEQILNFLNEPQISIPAGHLSIEEILKELHDLFLSKKLTSHITATYKDEESNEVFELTFKKIK